MCKDYFSTRSSVRQFSNKEIPVSLLESILERAMRAPTCGNMQLYSVIVTKEKDLKKALAMQHFNQPAAVNAPVILTICADFNRFTRWCEINGAAPGYSNFHSFIVALTDAIIFAQQITTIAEMEGLGTCYLGTVNYNAQTISEMLRLPDLVVPVASLAIGYPEGNKENTERLPLEAVLHYEYYRDDSDEKIQNLFKDKMEYPSNIEFVKINNVPNLAHIFTQIRYPQEMNESVSESFKNLIEGKSFK